MSELYNFFFKYAEKAIFEKNHYLNQSNKIILRTKTIEVRKQFSIFWTKIYM